jgi:two-component system cell cycle response regulator
MSARVLVVDDVEANVRLLQAKLEVEYYEVLTAHDGQTALDRALADQPDIILLDVMMPGIDGFEVCRQLKGYAATQHIPVVLVTALDGRRDRLTGLEAGADDFLTKPIDDVALFARVRSLTRLKHVIDELRRREASGRRLGVIEGAASRLSPAGARIIIADDMEHQAQRIAGELSLEHRPTVESDPEKAHLAVRARADLLIVNAATKSFDGLRLAAQVRSDELTRHVPILAIVDRDERARSAKALEIGINDILTRPIDPEELAARVKTLIRQKRYTDLLRDTLDNSLELAVTDTLTGLHNRRYMTSQASALVRRAALGGDPVSALLVDIDHFKRINDTFGHDVGDEVLREFALRLATNVRGIDLACRYGGEEFVVIMPDTQLKDALRIAERLRLHVAGTPFRAPGLIEPLAVTISVGVSCTEGRLDSPETLLNLAFTELNVLAHHRIVLLHDELVGLGAGVLLGDIEEAGVGRRVKADLD